jgi:hypothetical protein
MTRHLQTLTAAAMSIIWLLSITGCSSLKVVVDRDSTILIPPGSTWAWGPEPPERRPDELDPRVNNSIIHGRVKRSVEAALAQKGFRQVNDQQTADFLVYYRIGVRDARQIVTQAMPVAPTWGGWGWGYYGPPPIVTSREVTYTEGSLMIDLVQRSTGKLAFRAIGLDQDVTQADSSDEQITQTVARTLRDLT